MNEIHSAIYDVLNVTDNEYELLLDSINKSISKLDLSVEDKEIVAELVGYKIGAMIAYRASLNVQFEEEE